MAKKPTEFMKLYKVADDEVWEVRTGGAWAIKHAALERVAAEKNITFELPQFAEKDSGQKVVAMLVVGKMGDRCEWSVGEAAPGNNKNAYPYAMAEKRGKDRVILKLLNAHGAVYSESEADEFEQAPKRQNPHVTRPEDIVPEVQYDQYGQPIDNIPLGDNEIERLPKAKARDDFGACQKEMYATKTVAELERWGAANANRIATYPTDWQAIIRGYYSEHRDSLRQGKAA